jgi:hypothetical protein
MNSTKEEMNSTKKTARLAGLIYLIVVLTGIYSLAYVPSKLIVWKDANQTFQNITSSRQVFRLSILSSMVCYIAFLLLPFVLYKILRPVNETHAKLMVAFAFVSVPMSLLNLQNKMGVLTLTSGAEYLSAFDTKQLPSQVMLLLENYNSGIVVSELFWGLWLLPFGYLVYKSNFLPKLLGLLLMLGCFGDLIRVFGNIAIPNFNSSSISQYVSLPGSVGEIGICLWLLIFGTKTTTKQYGYQQF